MEMMRFPSKCFQLKTVLQFFEKKKIRFKIGVLGFIEFHQENRFQS